MLQQLFSPYTLKGHEIKNRIVMPPMEMMVRETRGGFVNDGHLRHYGKRAANGTGMIIVEATSVEARSLNVISQLGAWSDDHITGLAKLAALCKGYDAAVLLQLQHLGIRLETDPIGPSASQVEGYPARGMQLSELKHLQACYSDAIMRAAAAGFDGIEFHGVHGFLLNQFSSPDINLRTDTYGGSIENRLRFVREIVEKVRPRLADDFILGYRMPCNQRTIEDSITMARLLEAMGIDLLHVSSCGYSARPLQPPAPFDYHWIIYGASRIRQAVRIPVIAVSEIRTPERANALIRDQHADFAAIGKDLIVDPDWAGKAMRGEPIRYCQRCRPCVIFSGKNCVMLPGKKVSPDQG